MHFIWKLPEIKQYRQMRLKRLCIFLSRIGLVNYQHKHNKLLLKISFLFSTYLSLDDFAFDSMHCTYHVHSAYVQHSASALSKSHNKTHLIPRQ